MKKWDVKDVRNEVDIMYLHFCVLNCDSIMWWRCDEQWIFYGHIVVPFVWTLNMIC